MKRTLITGAAGFTGRYLAALLAASGHEVHGFVRGETGTALHSCSKIHVGDLSDAASLDRILAEVRPDHVVHLAAIAFVAHANLDEMYRTNILGTRELLAAISRLENRPQSILIASSANIYGNSRDGIIAETMPAAPANDYGVTKVATEILAGLYSDRLRVITVRPFNYIGRGQSVEFIIPKIIADVRRGAKEIELGNIDVARDFSDVRTVVSAYARLLITPEAIGKTLNVCSGRATSLRDILATIGRLSGHDFAVRINPDFVRADEVKSLCGTSELLEGIIGPLHMPPLDETLRWMLGEA